MPNIANAASRIGNTTTRRIAKDNHRGLTTAAAQARRKQYGPNAVVEEIAHALVLGGILMPALSAALLFGVAGTAIFYFTCLDWPKVWLFARLNLR
jgi:hypothetical protein